MRHPEITEQDKWSYAGFILQICAYTRNVSNFKTQNRQELFTVSGYFTVDFQEHI